MIKDHLFSQFLFKKPKITSSEKQFCLVIYSLCLNNIIDLIKRDRATRMIPEKEYSRIMDEIIGLSTELN